MLAECLASTPSLWIAHKSTYWYGAREGPDYPLTRVCRTRSQRFYPVEGGVTATMTMYVYNARTKTLLIFGSIPSALEVCSTTSGRDKKALQVFFVAFFGLRLQVVAPAASRCMQSHPRRVEKSLARQSRLGGNFSFEAVPAPTKSGTSTNLVVPRMVLARLLPTFAIQDTFGKSSGGGKPSSYFVSKNGKPTGSLCENKRSYNQQERTSEMVWLVVMLCRYPHRGDYRG